MTAIAGLLTTFCLLGMLSIAPSLAGDPPSLSVTDPTTQLSFTFPGTFQLTRYQDTPSLQPAQREALPRVLVLVERRFQTVTSPIVIGSLPTISLDVLTGSRAAFNQVFLTPEFRKTIGRHTVYELPAHQGPVEHQVFSYLVPLSADRIVEIAGHRYYFSLGTSGARGSASTHYDEVIAGIIGSLGGSL